jgi:hypothetical protein
VDSPSRLPGIDWRWALPRIAAVFLATRLLVLVVALAVEVSQPAPASLVRVEERPVLSSLTLWDGEYYLGIAADGYHADPSYGPDYAFYPGYPVTIRAAAALTLGDIGAASVAASNGAFFLALLMLYALSVRYLPRDRAILSLWFLALAPGAIAFALSYSDSLFLLLAVSAFLAAETRHPWLAGVGLALATLTRAPGILLALPLLLLFVQRDGWRPTRAWLPLLVAPIALAGWFVWLWWLTGDPMAAVSAQSYWDPPAASGTVIEGAGVPREHVAGLAPGLVTALWLGSVMFHCFLFVFFRPDGVRPAYWLVAILAVGSVFMAGRLQSAPRYLAIAWPFDWVLAGRASRVGRGIVLASFAGLQVVTLWLAFTWQVPP